jgi:chemotaxis protein CheX
MTATGPDSVRLRLPAVIDLRAASSLAENLRALRGRPVRLDASGVERLGGLGLQVLLSGRLTWRADRLDFTVEQASDAFQADCALMGAEGFDDQCGAFTS